MTLVIGPAILVRTFEWLSRTRADQWFVLGPLTIGTGLWLGITASIWESA